MDLNKSRFLLSQGWQFQDYCKAATETLHWEDLKSATMCWSWYYLVNEYNVLLLFLESLTNSDIEI